MIKCERSFRLGVLDIDVSVYTFDGWPSLWVSQDINMGEYRICLSGVGTIRTLDSGSWFSPDIDGIQGFMAWAGALCHVCGATIDQTVGFYNGLNLLLKVEVGSWERRL